MLEYPLVRAHVRPSTYVAPPTAYSQFSVALPLVLSLSIRTSSVFKRQKRSEFGAKADLIMSNSEVILLMLDCS
jgi:hypothetical protein